jgi:hypothetical protein
MKLKSKFIGFLKNGWSYETVGTYNKIQTSLLYKQNILFETFSDVVSVEVKEARIIFETMQCDICSVINFIKNVCACMRAQRPCWDT